MIARTCLALLAVLAAGWLAITLRNDLATKHGIYAVFAGAAKPPHDPVAQRSMARGLRQLRDAQTLNPDATPAVYEALVQSLVQHRADGRRRLVALGQAYPQDPLVWLTIARVTLPSDPLAVQAREHLRAIRPLR